MDDLEDELDLKYHRELDPDVYYRCPTLESLDGALRNELDKNAASLIPLNIVTEFVFALSSTITIPVPQQSNLDALIEPTDYLQSITVDHALCREIDGKSRLKIQRAIARSIVEAIQEADGFKYMERTAYSKDGGDGARFRYVCQDSLQNRYRKKNMKTGKENESDENDPGPQCNVNTARPTYDCAGAIHLKFSLKREAINVVYKHNPIHPKPELHESDLLAISTTTKVTGTPSSNVKVAKVAEGQPKKRKKKDAVEDSEVHGVSPLADSSKAPPKSKRKKISSTPTEPTRKSPTKKAERCSNASVTSVKTPATTLSKRLPKGKACVRCRGKKIKCNEAKPTCDQCQRGLWECDYEISRQKRRSKISYKND